MNEVLQWVATYKTGVAIGFLLGWSAAFGLMLLIAAASRLNPEEDEQPDPHTKGFIG